jgi:hypothetical protein
MLGRTWTSSFLSIVLGELMFLSFINAGCVTQLLSRSPYPWNLVARRGHSSFDKRTLLMDGQYVGLVTNAINPYILALKAAWGWPDSLFVFKPLNPEREAHARKHGDSVRADARMGFHVEAQPGTAPGD